MAKKGQLTAAWEMLSAGVMLRAKAKEHKLGRLLASLHGVEVELARVIAAGDEAGVGDSLASATPGGAEGMLEGAAVGTSRQGAGAGPRRPDSAEARSVKSLQPRRRQDAQLEAYSRKYLELAGQLKDMMVRGEVAACGLHEAYDTDGPGTQ